jgi:hypothetical protein
MWYTRKFYAIFIDYIKVFDLLAIVSVIRNSPDCGEDVRYVTKNTLTVSHVRIKYNLRTSTEIKQTNELESSRRSLKSAAI